MNRFAHLLDRLAYEPGRNAKLRLLQDFFANTPDPERGWALAAMTGGLTFREAKAGMIRGLVEERIDPVLFRLSHNYVGDLAETVALIWPGPDGVPPSPRTRGEGRDDLVVGATSPKGEGEGSSPDEPLSAEPPHLRLPARSADDNVGRALSPRAGRGDAHPADVGSPGPGHNNPPPTSRPCPRSSKPSPPPRRKTCPAISPTGSTPSTRPGAGRS